MAALLRFALFTAALAAAGSLGFLSIAGAQTTAAVQASDGALPPDNISSPPTPSGSLEPEADSASLAAELSNEVLTKKHPELAPAWEKLKKNDQKGAEEILKAAVAKAPTLPPVELMLAHFYLAQNNGQRAVYELDEATKANPQDPGAYLTLAGIALAQGRFTEGAMLLERAEKLLAAMPDSNPRKKPIQLILHNHWASVLGRYTRWTEARDRLQQMLKLEPDNAMGHYRLATVLFELRDGKRGYEEFQTAYKLNKKIPTPPIAVVVYYQRANQPELAEKWLEFADKQFSKDGPTQLHLATTRWQQGRADDARRHAQAAAAADPNNMSVQFLLGVIAHYDGDLKTAEDKLEAAFKVAQGDLQVRDQLAKVLIQSADPAKRNRALAIAQQSVQSAQNNRDLLATFAWILYNSGQTDSAIQAFSALAQGPLNGDAAYFVARVLVDRKQNADAKKLLTSALEQKGLFVHRRDAEKLLDQLKA